MAESVHVGATPETTRGVSGNPDIVKELLALQKKSKKNAEAKKTVENETDSGLKQLAKELQEQRELTKSLSDEIKELKELILKNAGGENTPGDTVNTPESTNPWEKMGEKMREAGITDETTPKHEEEFYGPITPAVETPPIVDPIVDPPVEVPPVEHTPSVIPTQPEANPHQEMIDGAAAELEQNMQALNGVIEQFAKARVGREKLLSGGGAQTELELQAGNLNEVFEQWASSFAKFTVARYEILVDYQMQSKANRAEATQKIAELQVQLIAPPEGRATDAEINAHIKELQEYVEELNQYDADLLATANEVDKYIAEEKAKALIAIRTKVDAAMLAEREARHPKLTKVTEWLKKHPKSRIAAGVVLAGMGLVGAATGNAPLVGVAIAGRAALRGGGTYNVARGAGEWIGDRRYNKTDINSVEDYTEAAQRQTKTRRRSKRAGAAAGVALAAAPVVGSLLHGADAPPTGNNPPVDHAPVPPVDHAPVPQVDHSLDWLKSPEAAQMFSTSAKLRAEGFTDTQIFEMLKRVASAPAAQAVEATPGLTG
ncbi:hypothetical protein H0W80_01380 [Candidatus Saccharibacteria bacterium]|nr:hypothetical protein [Candidatus Saccharibacteria bacterium]